MIGKDFWDDMDMDITELQIDIELAAHKLVNEYGKSLTEGDLLKLNAMTDTSHNGVERAYAKSALQHYKRKNFTPEFIHQHKTIFKKSWWKFWRAA